MVTRYVGECPVCEGSYRLLKLRMVHHGYQRPGHGSIVGDCPGVGWAPWEISSAGTVDYVDRFLRPRLLVVQAWLDRASRGEITELLVQEYDGFEGRRRKYKTKRLTLADGYEFTQRLRDKTRERQHEDEALVREINRRELRIANWREQPVRTEEEDVARREQERAPARAAREQARTEKLAKRSALDAKQAAREQERLDLMNEYRAIFNALAFDGTPEARVEAKRQWIAMHKRKGKKGYLRFIEPDLEIDEALLALGLAVPNPRPYGRWDYVYANDLGWDPRP